MHPGARIAAAVVCAGLAAPATSPAHEPVANGASTPPSDIFALSQGDGQRVADVPVDTRPEPPLAATPQAECGPGSRPEPGVQGRVPEGSAADGLWCNLRLLSHSGRSGGFRVWRYTDRAGRECAYYDTALLYPLNALQLSGDSDGVIVLDMSDPAHPVQTATLTDVPMRSPHESLNLNARRGLLAAVMGNPGTFPGIFTVYDVSGDCRHPVHKATFPIARLGHESGFSEDGLTFYAAGTGQRSVTAIDLADPASPRVVWQGQVASHGLSLSDDGDRAYIADAVGSNLTILDTSEIQARATGPQARQVSRLTWRSASIPQNAIPFTREGRPYLLEVDEYSFRFSGGDGQEVGAARIIDIADETAPRVVSNLRLRVHDPDEQEKAAGDPGASSPVQGYAGHYCNVPSRVDPQVVACSFIASGLRVFDISDVERPREIAYFVAPTRGRVENGYEPSNYAMSQPQVIPERREVWYSDGTSGFYVLRLAEDAWPRERRATRCVARRSHVVTVRASRRSGVRRVSARLGGRRVRAIRRGRGVRVRVDLRRARGSRVRLVVRMRLADGRLVRRDRMFRICS